MSAEPSFPSGLNLPIDPQAESSEYKFAATLGLGLAQRGVVPEKVQSTYKKLALYGQDKPEAACAKGCSHCCHRPVPVSLVQLRSIVHQIRSTWSEQEIADLRERCRAYENALKDRRFGPITGLRHPCPLLGAEQDCLLYDHRPGLCRAVASTSVEACKTWKETGAPTFHDSVVTETAQAWVNMEVGFGGGLAHSSEFNSMQELGLALGALLDEDDASVLASTYWDQGFHPPVGGPFVTGLAAGAAADVKKVHEMQRDGLVQEAWPLLQQMSGTPARLMRLVVPPAYHSDDELQAWRERFRQELESIQADKLDPVDVYNNYNYFQSFELGYQGLIDTEDRRKLGQFNHDIVHKATPWLDVEVPKRTSGDKIRVGFISADLRFNNASSWAMGWASNLGPDFEIYAFSVGWEEDETTQRWGQIGHLYSLPGSIPESVAFIRSLELDAIIFTETSAGGRINLFAAYRLAPVQCTGWGFPITSGLPNMDYYLSSELMEPEDGDSHYTETLVRLPGSGLTYPEFLLVETKEHNLNLPDSALKLGMLQNAMKWVPRRDHLLKSIYERTQAPIILASTHDHSAKVLHSRLTKLGVDSRVAPKIDTTRFRKLLMEMDVSIDPVDWSGGNTTVRALLDGTPVVTLPGPTMRGRHSLAFLKLVGLDEAIATNEEDFIEKVCNPAPLREKLMTLDREVLIEDKRPAHALADFLRAKAAPGTP